MRCQSHCSWRARRSDEAAADEKHRIWAAATSWPPARTQQQRQRVATARARHCNFWPALSHCPSTEGHMSDGGAEVQSHTTTPTAPAATARLPSWAARSIQRNPNLQQEERCMTAADLQLRTHPLAGFMVAAIRAASSDEYV